MNENIISKLGLLSRFYIAGALAIANMTLVLVDYSFSKFNFEGYILIGTILNIIVIFFILKSIKCPNCKFKLFWSYFNNSKDKPEGYNPFEAQECPVCGFDPDKS